MTKEAIEKTVEKYLGAELTAAFRATPGGNHHEEATSFEHVCNVTEKVASQVVGASADFGEKAIAAAALHDAGKPAAMTTKGDVVVFYKHDSIGVPVVADCLNALQREDLRPVCELVCALHMKMGAATMDQPLSDSTTLKLAMEIEACPDPDAYQVLKLVVASDIGTDISFMEKALALVRLNAVELGISDDHFARPEVRMNALTKAYRAA